jgi:hypothetical protein
MKTKTIAKFNIATKFIFLFLIFSFVYWINEEDEISFWLTSLLGILGFIIYLPGIIFGESYLKEVTGKGEENFRQLYWTSKVIGFLFLLFLFLNLFLSKVSPVSSLYGFFTISTQILAFFKLSFGFIRNVYMGNPDNTQRSI